MRWQWLVAGMVLWLAAGICVRADGPDRPGGLKLESIRLTSGVEYRGLIQSERESELEFVEVRQPPGKPMFLIVRPIDPKQVASFGRLGETERSELARRIHEFRNRARIEVGRMEELTLSRPSGDAPRRVGYQGPWFALESTADEELTRRSIVRIEQIFRAYRQVLPPRATPAGPLRVQFFGSIEEYRANLAKKHFAYDHQALFLPESNTIITGSDLTRFSQRLAQTREENQRAQAQLDLLKANLTPRLSRLTGQLTQNGFRPDEIRDEVAAQRRALEEEIARGQRSIAELNRANDARFYDLTAQMFRRLAHEALHAYLENYLFPHERFDVPRWFNEGLAQVFEAGQLDGETLRLDAPAVEPLRVLQADLKSPEPLRLAELLAAADGMFLVSHAPHGVSQKHYAYSWGLVWYLAFYENVLDTPALEAYVARDAAGDSPLARFEKLVGRPLPEFESRWRQTMLALKPAH